MHFHVIHAKSRTLDVGGSRVDRLLQRSGFTRKSDKYLSLAADDSAIVTPRYEQGVALIVSHIGYARQH